MVFITANYHMMTIRSHKKKTTVIYLHYIPALCKLHYKVYSLNRCFRYRVYIHESGDWGKTTWGETTSGEKTPQTNQYSELSLFIEAGRVQRCCVGH